MIAWMDVLLPALIVGFAACCLWLGVRIVNRRERWAKWTAVAMALVLCYPGAYFALLKRKVYSPIGVDAATQQNLFEVEPGYRLQGETVEGFLAPAHGIDRRVQKDFWNTIEGASGRKWKNPSKNRQ